MNRSSSDLSSPESRSKDLPNNQLIQLISSQIAPLGYQVIYIELLAHPERALRVYIDHLDPSPDQGIGIEDCVKVSRALDEFLDTNLEIQPLLPSAYELEVSSPGVNRPLRTSNDFQRFAGQEVRIHLFRPLTAEEMGNDLYQGKNSKQKNFLGTLMGFEDNKVRLFISSSGGVGKKPGLKSNKKKKPEKSSQTDENSAKLTTNSAEGNSITIPLPLISKANLEPVFSFEGSDERE